LMIPTLLTATSVFIIAFIAAPPLTFLAHICNPTTFYEGDSHAHPWR
jgi:hypothetical protein